MVNSPRLSFWRWFFRGSGGRRGLLRFWNWWLAAHVFIGAVLAVLVEADLQTAANTVLLPLAGIFVGLSFAWAGNAQAMLQSTEMEEISKHHEGGFAEYVFVFQTAILTVLVTLVLWGVAGLGVFDAHLSVAENPRAYATLKGLLFAASSLTLRECWHVVLGAQWMLLIQQEVKNARETTSEDSTEESASANKDE